MTDSLKRNVGGQNITFTMISATTGVVDAAATVTVFVTVDNGMQMTGGGHITNKGNGQYTYQPLVTETIGRDCGFLFTAPGDITVNYDFQMEVPFGPLVDTTLTNGVPGRNFTRRQKLGLLTDIYQEGLLAKGALSRFEGMSELEKAEAELSEAQSAHDDATDRQRTSYSRVDWDAAEDTAAKVSAAKDRVGDLRAKDAKRRAMDDAKAKIKKQVADAIAKRRGH